MKVLGVIPARGGSKGIPGKNTKLLAGKPLIAYSIEAALASRLEHVVVSTEDDDIRAIVRQYGTEVIQRPPELAQDKTLMLPVIQHVIDSIQASYDAVMILQPTSPLRTQLHINAALDLFAEDPQADSLVSVVRTPHSMSPVSLMEIRNGYLKSYFDQGMPVLRRQEKPLFYARNGAAIYITRKERLIEYIWGGNILPYEMNKLDSIDIDDMEDWVLAESVIMRRGLTSR